MNYNNLSYESNHQVAVIELKRPQVLNAMSVSMMVDINDALDRALLDSAVRVVLLTAQGRGFCVGADLREFQVSQEDNIPRNEKGLPDLGYILETIYNPLLLKMRNLEKPIICAVNGLAVGAGANLALMCDLTIAARSAAFHQAFVNIGLMPDMGGTWILPRLVGRQRAMGLALLGEPISAEQAEQWGLIWKVVDDAELMAFSLAVAQKLANGACLAHIKTKQALNASSDNTLEQQLAIEALLQRQLGHTEDFVEGFQAFQQKRNAVFVGR